MDIIDLQYINPDSFSHYMCFAVRYFTHKALAAIQTFNYQHWGMLIEDSALVPITETDIDTVTHSLALTEMYVLYTAHLNGFEWAN